MAAHRTSRTFCPKRWSGSGRQLHQKSSVTGQSFNTWRTTAGPPPEALGGNSVAMSNLMDSVFSYPVRRAARLTTILRLRFVRGSTAQESVILVAVMNQIISSPAKREDISDHFLSGMTRGQAVMKFHAKLQDIQSFSQKVLNHCVFEAFNVNFEQVNMRPAKF